MDYFAKVIFLEEIKKGHFSTDFSLYETKKIFTFANSILAQFVPPTRNLTMSNLKSQV